MKISILQITKNCNQNCVYCMRDKTIKELSFEEAKEKIDHLDKDLDQIIITGGEPTLNKDLFKIISYAKTKVPKVHLQTNGVNFSDFNLCKEVIKSGADSILVAFPSINKQICEETAQTSDVYDKKVQAIKNLSKFKELELGVVIVITKNNYKELLDYIKFIDSISRDIYIQITYMMKYTNNLEKMKPYVVRFQELKPFLDQALSYCKSRNLQFRIDGIPLCYVSDYLDYVSDIRTRDYSFVEDFMDAKRKEYVFENYEGKEHVKSNDCSKCVLNKMCWGVYGYYTRIYGFNEIEPIPIRKVFREDVMKTIVPSYRCNNNCIFCGVHNPRFQYADLTYEQIKEKILKAKRDGIKLIEFHGGECTIYTHIIKLLKFIKNQNLKFSLTTNARMFSNENFAKSIPLQNVHSIYFSLHGPNSQINDSITRTPNSFNQTVLGIKNLQALGVKNLMSNTTIVKQNYKLLKEMAKFLIEELNIRNMRFSLLWIEGNALKNYKTIVPSMEEIRPFLNDAMDYLKDFDVSVSIEWAPFCLLPKYTSCIMSYSKRSGESFMKSYVKSGLCNKCRFYNDCIGLHKNYIKIFGNKEIFPLNYLSNCCKSSVPVFGS